MTSNAANKVQKRLKKLGIQTLTGTFVTAETAGSIKTSAGSIKSHNVIWTAGTTNNPFFKKHSNIFDLNDRGKVIVNSHLQATSNIYVAGDNAATEFSGLAITAIMHADYIASDIIARINHKDRPILKERHPIQVVPTGDKWAVFQYRNIVLSGRLMGMIRRIADIIGYTDVLGPIRAMTIWKNSDRADKLCSVCKSR